MLAIAREGDAPEQDTHIAEDNGRHDRVVVAHADVGLERLVRVGQLARALEPLQPLFIEGRSRESMLAVRGGRAG